MVGKIWFALLSGSGEDKMKKFDDWILRYEINRGLILESFRSLQLVLLRN